MSDTPQVHLDFETRSAIDLTKTGAWRYAEDESTQILCMCYKFGDSPTVHLWLPYDPPPKDLLLHINSGGAIVAHNAFFEQCIWYNICVLRYGWSEVPIPQWRCSAAMAAAHALPRSLLKCGAALKLGVIKDETARRTMLKLCKPRNTTKFDDTPWHYKDEDYQILYEYCKQDVLAEEAIDQFLRGLTRKEQEVWEVDQVINRRGVYIDIEAVDAALTLIKKYSESFNHEIAHITGGEITSTGQVAKILKFITDRGVEAESLDKATVEMLLDHDLFPDAITRRVVELRKKGSKTSNKKYESIKTAICKDGRIKDCFMYHAASTGRFGGKLVQMQNLPRGIVKDMDAAVSLIKQQDVNGLEGLGDITTVLSSCIRGMFIPEKGNKYYVADYSSIEARVLLWLAGDEVGLDVFREGEDIYKDMAAEIYNVNINEVTDEQRRMGKQAILGLGFIMGANRFKATCESYGINITDEFAKKVVDIYRDKYSKVTKLWYGLERTALKAMKNPNSAIKCGKVTWMRHDRFLYCKLPSGRCLAYADPFTTTQETPWGQVKDVLNFWGVNSMTRQWTKQSTYSGRLTENVSQAVARDIMVHALVNCEKKGYPIVFHVHDEAIAEVPEGFGSLKEFEGILEDIPEWAEGLPIKAEGWEGYRYRK